MSLDEIVKETCDEYAVEAFSIRYSINNDCWTVFINLNDQPHSFKIRGIDTLQGDKHIKKICCDEIRQILLGQS